jgi:hypothetical protein
MASRSRTADCILFRRMLRRLFILATLTGLVTGPIYAQNRDQEDRLKATFLYNFAQYVHWPDTAFHEKTQFVVCIADAGFAALMELVIRGQSIGGRPMVVRQASAESDVKSCHLLFVSRDIPNTEQASILRTLAGSPVLTVGESDDFIQNGGIIRFINAANRIRFQINPGIAQRAGLSLSSRLLRLADIVREPQ